MEWFLFVRILRGVENGFGRGWTIDGHWFRIIVYWAYFSVTTISRDSQRDSRDQRPKTSIGAIALHSIFFLSQHNGYYQWNGHWMIGTKRLVYICGEQVSRDAYERGWKRLRAMLRVTWYTDLRVLGGQLTKEEQIWYVSTLVMDLGRFLNETSVGYNWVLQTCSLSCHPKSHSHVVPTVSPGWNKSVLVENEMIIYWLQCGIWIYTRHDKMCASCSSVYISPMSVLTLFWWAQTLHIWSNQQKRVLALDDWS